MNRLEELRVQRMVRQGCVCLGTKAEFEPPEEEEDDINF